MVPLIAHEVRAAADFPNWQFETLDFAYEPASRSAWVSFKAEGDPCFTFQTLVDMANVRESLRALFATSGRGPLDYVVLASNKPGVFNLGGDLAMFARSIRSGERDSLRTYAHACIDVMHGMISAYGLPVVTLAVISGQALGGGFEAALAQDFLFADERATLGVPEVAFNTFPGMGAITLLQRRIGVPLTERIVASGDSYSARQMADLNIVDAVFPAHSAREAVLAWMTEGGEAARARRLAVTNARRTCFPVSRSELIKIVDIWTDCSCDVTSRDLRHMDRLVSAQRRMAS